MNLALSSLPYAIDALEPHLSRRTLLMHHEHHHAGYLEKTRRLVHKTSLEHAPLEQIVTTAAQSNQTLVDAAAQAASSRGHLLGGGGFPADGFGVAGSADAGVVLGLQGS